MLLRHKPRSPPSTSAGLDPTPIPVQPSCYSMRSNQKRDPRVDRPLQASETVAPPSPPCVTSSRPLPRLAVALLTPSARRDRGANPEDPEPPHRLLSAPELPHPCPPS